MKKNCNHIVAIRLLKEINAPTKIKVSLVKMRIDSNKYDLRIIPSKERFKFCPKCGGEINWKQLTGKGQ